MRNQLSNTSDLDELPSVTETDFPTLPTEFESEEMEITGNASNNIGSCEPPNTAASTYV